MEYQGEENLNVMKLAINYNNWLINQVCKDLTEKKTILDFGSGDAFFAKSIASKLNKNVLCVEPAENLYKYYTNTPYKSLDECINSSIDFIYSLNVLEHIENDKKIIDDFYRVLQPNGTVFLYLPASPSLWTSMDDLVGHYRRYTRKDVSRLFDSEKWEIKQVRYADFCGYFITILFKLIGSQSGKIKPTQIKIYDKYIFPLSVIGDKITGGKFLGKNIIIKATKK